MSPFALRIAAPLACFIQLPAVVNSPRPVMAARTGMTLHVAPDGDDGWSGHRPRRAGGNDGPFRTIIRARDAVRELKRHGALPAGGVTIAIAAGIYPLAAGIEFTAEDSGTDSAPIVYRGQQGETRLLGGRVVQGFQPVRDPAVRARLAAPDKVLVLDLKAAGVTDFGHIAASGFGRREPLAHLQLAFDGEPLRLAEWPNRKWTKIASVPPGTPIIDSSGKRRGTKTDRFHFSGDRPLHWQALDDVWVHGYWFVDWADQYLRVKDIDRERRAVIIAEPGSGYGYKKGQRFRFLNILEELDEPGEFYLDRRAGKLYAWLPKPPDKGVATVSMLTKPLVSVHDASHLRLISLTVEGGRSDGVVVQGGEDVALLGCYIRNLGGAGVRVNGGRGHRVQSCDLYNLGDGGIYLQGGDRRTLAPAGHVADNNHIHHYSLWVRTYRVGIRASGVGIRVSHNFIHDAPHSGILYGGNDHRIEWNELSRICLDTGDVGAIYTGRDWSARGTVIQGNHLHHLGGVNMGSNAIYLDDLASGQTIRDNLIHDVWRGMMIGGGRDNIVEHNIFANFRIGIHLDARGIGWSRKLIEGRKGSWDMYGRLESVPYNKPPYATRYPELPDILQEKPLEPKNNRIAHNLFIGDKWLDLRGFTIEQAEQRGWAHFEDNVLDGARQLVDVNAGDFRLRPDAPARLQGFTDLPLDRMGLRIDEYRTRLPSTP